MKIQTYFILLTILLSNSCQAKIDTNSIPELPKNRLQNEYWIWNNNMTIANDKIEISEKQNVVAIRECTFYFSEDGNYKYHSHFSGGGYYRSWSFGQYEYLPDSNIIILYKESGKNAPLAYSTLDTLHIENMTPKLIKLSSNNLTPYYLRTQDAPMLAMQGIDQLLEVSSIILSKGDSELHTISPDQFRPILRKLNSAIYDLELNDGRMMKMPVGDTKLIVKSKWDNIIIQCWTDSNRIKVDGKWFRLGQSIF